MAWGCVYDIEQADAGLLPGSIKLVMKLMYIQNSGLAIHETADFDFPITATNWKNVIADHMRARTISNWGEIILPNDILYCDFSRG